MSDSTARGAKGTPGADRPKRLPRHPLEDKRKWPSYSAPEQILIATFLGAELAKVEAAVAGARKLSRGAAPDHPAKKTLAYWENVASGIRWMIDHVGKRQQHLAVAKWIEEHPGEELEWQPPAK